MNAIETLARELDRLNQGCYSLLEVLAALKSGELSLSRVEVDLPSRSWAVSADVAVVATMEDLEGK